MFEFIWPLLCGFSYLPYPLTRPSLSDILLIISIPFNLESRNTGNVLILLWHHFRVFQNFPGPFPATVSLLIWLDDLSASWHFLMTPHFPELFLPSCRSDCLFLSFLQCWIVICLLLLLFYLSHVESFLFWVRIFHYGDWTLVIWSDRLNLCWEHLLPCCRDLLPGWYSMV